MQAGTLTHLPLPHACVLIFSILLGLFLFLYPSCSEEHLGRGV